MLADLRWLLTSKSVKFLPCLYATRGSSQRVHLYQIETGAEVDNIIKLFHCQTRGMVWQNQFHPIRMVKRFRIPIRLPWWVLWVMQFSANMRSSSRQPFCCKIWTFCGAHYRSQAPHIKPDYATNSHTHQYENIVKHMRAYFIKVRKCKLHKIST